MMRALILWCPVLFWALVCLLMLAGCGGGGDAQDDDEQLHCPTVSERGSHAHGICPEPLQ